MAIVKRHTAPRSAVFSTKPKNKPQYYQERGKLLFHEYGRNVQNMVDYALTVKDKAKQTQLCNEIIQVMTNIIPGQKDSHDYKRKLWDHLHIMSNFKLNTDSPYPKPDKDTIHYKAKKRPEYNTTESVYKHYGRNIELMVESAKNMEPGIKRNAYIALLANAMKIVSRQAGKEIPSDNVIVANIKELSGDILEVSPEDIDINKYSDVIAKTPQSSQTKIKLGQHLAVKEQRRQKFQSKSQYKGRRYNPGGQNQRQNPRQQNPRQNPNQNPRRKF